VLDLQNSPASESASARYQPFFLFFGAASACQPCVRFFGATSACLPCLPPRFPFPFFGARSARIVFRKRLSGRLRCGGDLGAASKFDGGGVLGGGGLKATRFFSQRLFLAPSPNLTIQRPRSSSKRSSVPNSPFIAEAVGSVVNPTTCTREPRLRGKTHSRASRRFTCLSSASSPPTPPGLASIPSHESPCRHQYLWDGL
jgi:hypothetical protein